MSIKSDQTTCNTFCTSDFGLAAALVALGFQIYSTDKSNPRRVVFCFQSSDNLSVLVEKFWNNELTVDAREYFESQKMLKSRIYS